MSRRENKYDKHTIDTFEIFSFTLKNHDYDIIAIHKAYIMGINVKGRK